MKTSPQSRRSLACGTRMDRDGFNAHLLGHFGYIDCDDVVFVPAGADLDGERDTNGGAGRL